MKSEFKISSGAGAVIGVGKSVVIVKGDEFTIFYVEKKNSINNNLKLNKFEKLNKKE